MKICVDKKIIGIKKVNCVLGKYLRYFTALTVKVLACNINIVFKLYVEHKVLIIIIIIILIWLIFILYYVIIFIAI